ncbi:MAG: permease [Pseudomonadota bacterium]
MQIVKQLIINIIDKIRGDRRLGVVQNKRQYDLPLERSSGTNFLMLLIALMTFLIIIAMIGSVGINRMTSAWADGLENKATIEIPAEKSDGTLRSQEQIDNFATDVAKMLTENQYVNDFQILSKDDVAELVSPWLGQDVLLNDIALPQLISVEFHSRGTDVINDMTQSLALINDNIRLDTHESWLAELLKITNTFQIAGALIVIIIAFTTITAVAGGVRSRMAIYRADIELLHLMGATDEYITQQFQRHALIISAKGSAGGTMFALFILILMGTLHISGMSSIPETGIITGSNFTILLFTPLFACLVSIVTARTTVLRELAQMP